ncbi:hypothetical protein MTR_4g008880 [Medicago truncatula]|uniref:Uncharacterized protein n=1 Tax=Medicago truncatula TaxID=3880 RepID=A0A072UHR1_MEDTR|nr:hypothetical protein MTR_4g008880 [Medicago truncatula]
MILAHLDEDGEIGMTIALRLNGYPHKIPTMGRVKPRYHGSETGSGNTHEFNWRWVQVWRWYCSTYSFDTHCHRYGERILPNDGTSTGIERIFTRTRAKNDKVYSAIVASYRLFKFG